MINSINQQKTLLQNNCDHVAIQNRIKSSKHISITTVDLEIYVARNSVQKTSTCPTFLDLPVYSRSTDRQVCV